MKMKYISFLGGSMRRIIFFIMLILLCPAFTAGAAGQLTRSVESFDILIDGSSVMGKSNGASLGRVLRQLNEEIPEIGYPEAGMHTFAPEAAVLDFEEYSRARFAQGIDELMGRFPDGKNTSLGRGLDFYAPVYSDMLRKGAVIVFTDGSYGQGRDSLNEAKIFYLTQPEMCLHFVSFAQNEKAQKLIDDMAAVSDCSVSVRADELLDNQANTEDFVRRIFYDGSPDGAAALSAVTPVIDFVMLSIPFGFDSSALDANTVKVADAVAERLKADPALQLKIDGYTCTVGPAEYNLKLSARRAATVKNYLVNAGIEPSRIEARGFGEESPRYDNDTREGRSLNRRVEFTFFVPENAR